MPAGGLFGLPPAIIIIIRMDRNTPRTYYYHYNDITALMEGICAGNTVNINDTNINYFMVVTDTCGESCMVFGLR